VLHNEITRGLREQDLPTVSGTHDASRVMHVHPNIAICSQPWFTCMQTNAHPHRDTVRPGMRCQDSLYGCGSRNPIAGTRKGHEKRVSLGINLETVVLLEHAAQQVPAIS
jgi:hypothetical protein